MTGIARKAFLTHQTGLHRAAQLGISPVSD